MTIRTLTWCTDTELDCGSALPTIAFFCVPAFIVNAEAFKTDHSFVSGTVESVRPSTCSDLCGPCKFVYTLSYDDAQLVSGYQLVESQIGSVLCNDCMLNILIILISSLPGVIQSTIDAAIAANGPIVGIKTIDLNDSTPEEITINSSNYIPIDNSFFVTNSSGLISNAMIEIYRDAALTELLVSFDLTNPGYADPLDYEREQLVGFANLRRTEPILYVKKTVLEGAPKTIDVLILGTRLD